MAARNARRVVEAPRRRARDAASVDALTRLAARARPPRAAELRGLGRSQRRGDEDEHLRAARVPGPRGRAVRRRNRASPRTKSISM